MEKKVLLIIPAYNEEDNILNTCNSIYSYNKKYNTNYDIVVINDGSTDKTEEILLKNKINHIKLVHNLGIGGAVQTGYKYAYNNNYDIAIQFDGDGQHDVTYVKDLIDPIIKEQADFTIGSRFITNEKDGFKSTAARRIGIKLISLFIKIFAHKKIYDTTSGFRACNKKIIKRFAKDYPLEYPEPITTVEVIRNNFNVKEIHVKMNERVGGTSSIRAWKNIYYMVNVLLSIIMASMRRSK